MSHEILTPALPVNACLIRRAERLDNDPAKGWLFSIMVRSSMMRMQTMDS